MSEVRPFGEDIAELYDRILVPALFRPYAVDLARRVAREAESGATILETACGTGVLTQELIKLDGTELVATDLSEAMLRIAESSLPSITFKRADLLQLPFPDGSFQVVTCQFGLMFVDDLSMAMTEAHRVLANAGSFLFNVWGKHDDNPLSAVAEEVARRELQTDQTLYGVPFRYSHHQSVIAECIEAGFEDVSAEHVSLMSGPMACTDIAEAFVYGNPIVRGLTDDQGLEQLTSLLAEEYLEQFGQLVSTPLSAWTYRCQKDKI